MARRYELGAGNVAGVIATAAFLLYWIAVIWFLANTVEDMSIGHSSWTAQSGTVLHRVCGNIQNLGANWRATSMEGL